MLGYSNLKPYFAYVIKYTSLILLNVSSGFYLMKNKTLYMQNSHSFSLFNTKWTYFICVMKQEVKLKIM